MWTKFSFVCTTILEPSKHDVLLMIIVYMISRDSAEVGTSYNMYL